MADSPVKVFDEQAARWDEDFCSGRLRWQIFSSNDGYNYENSVTNWNFYQLASRISCFKSNKTCQLG
jgi:mannan endo-1,6-alpha-mannosidase